MTAEAIAPVPKAYWSGFLSSTRFSPALRTCCDNETEIKNSAPNQPISTARTRLDIGLCPNLHQARTQPTSRSRTKEDEAEEEEKKHNPGQ